MWTKMLTLAEIDARYASIAKLDPSFAARCRKFYESRTPSQLASLAAQAWNCNDAEGYQMARSFAAL